MNIQDNSDNTDFWLGPYGIRVPNSVQWITDADGGNTLYKRGGSTEMYCPNPPTEEEYKKKYCTLGINGYYYWTEKTWGG